MSVAGRQRFSCAQGFHRANRWWFSYGHKYGNMADCQESSRAMLLLASLPVFERPESKLLPLPYPAQRGFWCWKILSAGWQEMRTVRSDSRWPRETSDSHLPHQMRALRGPGGEDLGRDAGGRQIFATEGVRDVCRLAGFAEGDG